MTATPGRRHDAVIFFVGQGWASWQSAGIAANLETESGWRHDAVGDGGQAYGIGQWHPDRQSNFAGLFGKRIQDSTFEEQLAFVHAELRGTEKRAGDALGACTTAADAGAVVSRLYERPADREGEAAKRATLAQIIFDELMAGAPIRQPDVPAQQATPEVAPQPTTEKPMGALLMPLLTSIIGSFTNPAVAQNAMQLIVKGGDKATAGQNLLNTLLGAVATAAGTTPAAMKADDKVAIQAVAAVQADPDKLKAVEDVAAAHLNAVMPFIQQLAVLDQMRYEAENKGRQVVSTIAIEEHKAGLWDMTRTLVYIAGGVLSLISLGLLSAILYQSIKDGAIDPGLLGLSGPILMATIKAWDAIMAYRFDGSKASQAAQESTRATERYREETGKA